MGNNYYYELLKAILNKETWYEVTEEQWYSSKRLGIFNNEEQCLASLHMTKEQYEAQVKKDFGLYDNQYHFYLIRKIDTEDAFNQYIKSIEKDVERETIHVQAVKIEKTGKEYIERAIRDGVKEVMTNLLSNACEWLDEN